MKLIKDNLVVKENHIHCALTGVRIDSVLLDDYDIEQLLLMEPKDLKNWLSYLKRRFPANKEEIK